MEQQPYDVFNEITSGGVFSKAWQIMKENFLDVLLIVVILFAIQMPLNSFQRELRKYIVGQCFNQFYYRYRNCFADCSRNYFCRQTGFCSIPGHRKRDGCSNGYKNIMGNDAATCLDHILYRIAVYSDCIGWYPRSGSWSCRICDVDRSGVCFGLSSG